MGLFTMPSLGADMEDGTLVEWLKQPGDPVKRGDIIAVVETEKGAIEIEIFEDGTIAEILVPEGRKVPVGTALASIATDGETPATAPSANQAIADEMQPAPSPPVRAEPIAAVTVAGQAVRASPAARRYAGERHVDLAGITGSGPGGAIQLSDVEAVEGTKAKPPKRSIDADAMRHAIASAMSRSKREIPHYYLSHRIDVQAAQDWLERYNGERSPPDRILFGALLVKATVLAVHDFPEFNGHFETDRFTPIQAVHAGIAIAIRGGGLVAPAIMDADRLPLADLMIRMRDLIGRVRQGGFRASELTSSTITINSLGDRGVDGVFPIIYPPQVAILGFGRIAEQPWVSGNDIVARPVLQMTLAADHRASDGHRGGLFLNAIADHLSSPEAL